MAGLFITMEGTDGSGKTTQLELLRDYLEKKHFDVVMVREPGGTSISEQIREVILSTKNREMKYITEALLYASSRAQLVHEVIIPNLKNGSVVLCDRYVDSSLVYQGVARNLGVNLVKNINNIATSGLSPDLTFFLDLPPSLSIERKQKQKELDRVEMEKSNFHERVYKAYKKLALENPVIKEINAVNSVEFIHKDIVNEIEKLFKII